MTVVPSSPRPGLIHYSVTRPGNPAIVVSVEANWPVRSGPPVTQVAIESAYVSENFDDPILADDFAQIVARNLDQLPEASPNEAITQAWSRALNTPLPDKISKRERKIRQLSQVPVDCPLALRDALHQHLTARTDHYAELMVVRPKWLAYLKPGYEVRLIEADGTLHQAMDHSPEGAVGSQRNISIIDDLQPGPDHLDPCLLNGLGEPV